ncbi:MAG: hypothetical protein H8E32_15795 [Nitrospinae bacterium]|nr:hypothetical protein [Nitrospinota bacterium]
MLGIRIILYHFLFERVISAKTEARKQVQIFQLTQELRNREKAAHDERYVIYVYLQVVSIVKLIKLNTFQ